MRKLTEVLEALVPAESDKSKEVRRMPRFHDSCPMCGCNALIANDHMRKGHFVFCTYCHKNTKRYPTKEEAMEAWDKDYDDEWKAEGSTKVIHKIGRGQQ